MSNRFVRKSSFRHVHGVAAKPEQQFTSLQPQNSGDGNYIAANEKFFCYAGRGGGGPVVVHDRSKPGRSGAQVPKLTVHRAKVLDFDWNPFNDNMLATCGEDCYIKISNIPDGGLTTDIKEAFATMEGHEKKVAFVKWHPTASHVLASASYDHTIKVWDVAAQTEACNFEGLADSVQSIAWNPNGSQMAATAKDKKIRIFDPRAVEAVQETKGFSGSKKSSVVWLSKINMLGAVGFTSGSSRRLKIYDPRNFGEALHTVDIDRQSSVLLTHYDPDTSMLYLAGKGDSSIRYYEIVGDKPYAHTLSEFRDNESQKGVCFLPKRSCDVKLCEVAKAYRLMSNSVVPISFRVPRKSDLFQKDLFPPAYAGEATQDAKAYFDGGNAEPKLTSMKPGEGSARGAAQMVVKKSAAELQRELDAALARIKELEAQLAAK